MFTLYVRDKDGFQEASDSEVLLKAQELVEQKFRSRPVLKNTESIHDYLKVQLGGREHEVFAAIFLDTHRRVIKFVELFRGTIDTTQVYTREVIVEALAHNAADVIFVHNHPSGIARPSEADQVLTLRLMSALAIIGVRVLDHLVVGESVESLVELGLL